MKAPLTAKSAENSREERIEEIEEQSLALLSLRYFFALFAVKSFALALATPAAGFLYKE
jgi:hypothetical protein